MPWRDPRDTSEGGSYFIDDRTGRKERLTDAKMEWSGKLVHEDQWEGRHPQDTVRGPHEPSRRPNPSPEPHDRFVFTNPVTADDL